MKETELKPFIEDTIYPLTIIADRYSGTYSRGSYLAWNLDPDCIPEGAQGYDGSDALEFWDENTIPCGKGRTVKEALADLYIQLNRSADEDCEYFVPKAEGEWKDRHENKYANHYYECSVCGKPALNRTVDNGLGNPRQEQALSPYCPHCGAKMKGGAE